MIPHHLYSLIPREEIYYNPVFEAYYLNSYCNMHTTIRKLLYYTSTYKCFLALFSWHTTHVSSLVSSPFAPLLLKMLFLLTVRPLPQISFPYFQVRIALRYYIVPLILLFTFYEHVSDNYVVQLIYILI